MPHVKSEKTESHSSHSNRLPVSFKIAGFNTSGSEAQSSAYQEMKATSPEKEVLFPPGERE